MICLYNNKADIYVNLLKTHIPYISFKIIQNFHLIHRKSAVKLVIFFRRAIKQNSNPTRFEGKNKIMSAENDGNIV